jgi:hypothetical protein
MYDHEIKVDPQVRKYLKENEPQIFYDEGAGRLKYQLSGTTTTLARQIYTDLVGDPDGNVKHLNGDQSDFRLKNLGTIYS